MNLYGIIKSYNNKQINNKKMKQNISTLSTLSMSIIFSATTLFFGTVSARFLWDIIISTYDKSTPILSSLLSTILIMICVVLTFITYKFAKFYIQEFKLNNK